MALNKMEITKICNEGKILNPVTNRCVKIDGRIGKKILKAIEKPKILNPTTGKMVAVNSKNGKKLVETGTPTPVSPVGIKDKFMRIVEDCDKLSTIVTGEKIGKGSYGSVTTVCKVDGCKYVLKTQDADDSFKNEVEALYDLQKWKHAPKIYSAWTCKGKGYFIQEMVYKCNKRPSFDDMTKILDQLHRKGWVHVDVHTGNVMCREDGTIVLIDYGWARKSDNDDTKISDHPIKSRLHINNLTFGMLKMIETANVWESFEGPDEMLPELKEMEREFMKQANIDGKKKKISLSSKETVKKQLF